MELFEPILGMTMIVVRLLMLFGSVGLLLYGVWTSGDKKSPAGRAANSNVEVEPS